MKKFVLICLLSGTIICSFSQGKDEIVLEWEKMHKSKSQALESFNEAKFGMFIHWGAYSRLAGNWKGEKIKGLGEWIFHNAQISRGEYKQECSKFNPIEFDAEKWVRLAKDAGMKYIVAMPKHHDGFAMFDSKVTDYDIVDATSFGRDPMEELYKACQKFGLKFSVYYSQATDWMDGGDTGVADYLKNISDTNNISPAPVMEYMDSDSLWPANTWDPSPESFKDYLDKKSKPQMVELLNKFPEMQEIWYDVPQRMTLEQSFDFYRLAYEIQPLCLINSRVGNSLGDFFIPGDNEIPEGSITSDVFWETPGTLNDTWGFKSYDLHWKSTREVLFWVVEIASKGGNYLLNVGPDGNGIIPNECFKILKEIGDWMKINGDAIYGTQPWTIRREGPPIPDIRGRDEDGNIKTGAEEKIYFDFIFTSEDFWFTAKDNSIYAISLAPIDKSVISVKSLFTCSQQIKSIRILGNADPLNWEVTGDKVDIHLPPNIKNDVHGFALKVELTGKTF
jgi:alpha-L-fucosidase